MELRQGGGSLSATRLAKPLPSPLLPWVTPRPEHLSGPPRDRRKARRPLPSPPCRSGETEGPGGGRPEGQCGCRLVAGSSFPSSLALKGKSSLGSS